MAGLLKPAHAAPMVQVIRSVCDLPIHFHTHLGDFDKGFNLSYRNRDL